MILTVNLMLCCTDSKQHGTPQAPGRDLSEVPSKAAAIVATTKSLLVCKTPDSLTTWGLIRLRSYQQQLLATSEVLLTLLILLILCGCGEGLDGVIIHGLGQGAYEHHHCHHACHNANLCSN